MRSEIFRPESRPWRRELANNKLTSNDSQAWRQMHSIPSGSLRLQWDYENQGN